MRLQALASELGIAGRVLFAGHQDDVYPWFDSLDVAVTASVGEPFGLVTVEAMALGKPVVGVRSGGTAQIIEEGTSGLLVPPGDAASMATAICRVLSDLSLQERLREHGRRRAEVFSDRRMAERFARLLDEVRCDLRSPG